MTDEVDDIGPCRDGLLNSHQDPDNTGMCFRCGKILDIEDDEDREHNRDIDARWERER